MTTAVEALAGELFRLTEQDVRTPCHGADEWTSDHAEDRAYAAALCRPCSVLALCRQAADEFKVTCHVWGAQDRTTSLRSGIPALSPITTHPRRTR